MPFLLPFAFSAGILRVNFLTLTLHPRSNQSLKNLQESLSRFLPIISSPTYSLSFSNLDDFDHMTNLHDLPLMLFWPTSSTVLNKILCTQPLPLPDLTRTLDV